jgi:hypothetical protein
LQSNDSLHKPETPDYLTKEKEVMKSGFIPLFASLRLVSART